MRTTGPVTRIAHRGASAHAPENTIAALERAIVMGCDMVEVDVQRTRDGVLVLLHDLDLTRTTDVCRVYPRRAPWRVQDLTYRELLRLEAGRWFSPAYAEQRIPTLEQTIDLLHHTGTGLLLEVKKPALHPGIAVDISTTLRRFPGFVREGTTHERLVVQSFDHAVMRRFATLEPDIPVGLLGRPPVRRLPRLATWAHQVNPRHRVATEEYVAAVHAAGLACNVWTVDAPGDMRRVLDLDVDGVITNRPDVLAEALAPQLVTAG
ncbi:glycerophosphodiester phosphodiesterase [Nocardioides coralli]|uniref:glycerophosphodiester phosphodiesterase n=1 Tax=Nocardioides coralli TaxID=2872154 RepID=UPI001CA43F8C|nr:glycerophosphodiester phosphodiesterase family protein [Nocardioides coralli]QZY29713.1 glycerophosphodiester phosphodiesterase [Nocardioides coralli]